MTDRSFGSLNDQGDEFEQSLKKLMSQAKIPRPVWANQVHGDTILVLEEAPQSIPDADAFITQTKQLPLMIKVADCQAALMFDPQTQTIAAVHSGWKGSTLNIIGKTLQKMKNLGCDPHNIHIVISPSLGPCCAEFSDPKNELPAFCHRYVNEQNHVDFWALTHHQIKTEGVPEKNVEMPTKCTPCHSNQYYSYRKKDTGRMGVFIMLN